MSHDCKPDWRGRIAQVYVIYWPEHAILKIGITENPKRWARWENNGGRLIGISEACCTHGARGVERWMLEEVDRWGARAFWAADGSSVVLGSSGGFTECYRLVQSPRRGETPLGPYDFERAYGLILPRMLADFIDEWFALTPVPDWIEADYNTLGWSA